MQTSESCSDAQKIHQRFQPPTNSLHSPSPPSSPTLNPILTLNLQSISQALDLWFQNHGRDLPWRRTTDPYAILVSELMLQQTQVTTVLSRHFYTRWMQQFPDLTSLANADEPSILRAWEGLGYYRRARFLQKIAQIILTDHQGIFPKDPTIIRDLPGIGAYTAGAVLSFAFDQPQALVDGNVARVLSRLTNSTLAIDTSTGQKHLWNTASALLQHASSPRRHNSALIELGQVICRNGTPDCIRCPVKAFCLASNPANLPIKQKKITLTEITERVFFHLHPQKGILLEQETSQRRTGLWKLPLLPAIEPLPPVLHRSRYGITRYKVTLWVHQLTLLKDLQLPAQTRFIPIHELHALPMATPHRKALNNVLASQQFQLQMPA